MKQRIFAGNDSEMLLTCEIIADNAIHHIEMIQTINSSWNLKYFKALQKDIRKLLSSDPENDQLSQKEKDAIIDKMNRIYEETMLYSQSMQLIFDGEPVRKKQFTYAHILSGFRSKQKNPE